jgi:TfoX/Sxy family transcriptional regulator of competence genes
MSFDEQLGQRIGLMFDKAGSDFSEKRMFGGLAFMIDDKMCIGVVKDEIMLRVLDDKYKDVLSRPNVREMDFAGRPMKGFVYIERPAFETDKQLNEWIDLAIEFGKLGVLKSKKRKK